MHPWRSGCTLLHPPCHFYWVGDFLPESFSLGLYITDSMYNNFGIPFCHSYDCKKAQAESPFTPLHAIIQLMKDVKS